MHTASHDFARISYSHCEYLIRLLEQQKKYLSFLLANLQGEDNGQHFASSLGGDGHSW